MCKQGKHVPAVPMLSFQKAIACKCVVFILIVYLLLVGSSPPRFELQFLAVPDIGMAEDVLEARREREANSLKNFQATIKATPSLSQFSEWMHMEHLCYAVPRQVCRSWTNPICWARLMIGYCGPRCLNNIIAEPYNYCLPSPVMIVGELFI